MENLSKHKILQSQKVHEEFEDSIERYEKKIWKHFFLRNKNRFQKNNL